MADDVTCDAFLGGQLSIYQPKEGYRAGTDAVLLAAAVRAKPGESVLELGCGAGVATLCLARRVAGLSLAGVELQRAYVELATRNAAKNKVDIELFNGDVLQLPVELTQQSFDHVIMNPPYFVTKRLTKPASDLKKTAHVSDVGTTAAWIRAGFKRLRPKGQLTLIHRIEALPETLAELVQLGGEIRLMPIASRQSSHASRFIAQARKQSKADFVLEGTLVMHDGVSHAKDAGAYSDFVAGILRDGIAVW